MNRPHSFYELTEKMHKDRGGITIKKRILSFLFAFVGVLALILVLCMFHTPKEYRPFSADGQVYSGEASLSVAYSKWKNQVTVKLENTGGQALYDVRFSMGKLEDGVWQTRSHVTSSDSDGSGEEPLAPGETAEEELSGKYWIYRLEKSRYRICCSFTLEPGSDERFCIIKEFTVE